MRKYLLTLVLLLWATTAQAQVAFDARSEISSTTGTTSLTVAHTTSGSNRVLYCVGTSGGGLVDITTVTATYNSVSMTAIADVTVVGSRTHRWWRLVAPATGANNVVFSWSGNNYMRAICSSYTGVDQTTPEDSVVTVDGSGGGTSSTFNVTTGATNDMVVDALVATNGITTVTAGASQTEVNQEIADGTGAGMNGIASSYEAGAASVTMSWSWSGFVSYAGSAFNLNAAGAGGATCTGGLTLLGAGKC